MTSCSSMDSCQNESGECGQTESRCVPYVREQNPPAVRELPIQSTSKYEQLLRQEAIMYSNFHVCKTIDGNTTVKETHLWMESQGFLLSAWSSARNARHCVS